MSCACGGVSRCLARFPALLLLRLDRVALASACLVSAVVVTEPFAPYRIVHVNPAWVILCGYTAEEAIGETCAILQGPLTNRDDTRRFTRAVESSGLPASMVVLNYTKKGELFSNSIVSLPLGKIIPLV